MGNSIGELISRIDAVLDYIQKNPESDPNAYEMMDLTIEVADEGYEIRNRGEALEDSGAGGYICNAT